MELWSDARAAEHWGVSRSRARAILAGRGIHRVAGYPADEIRVVTRQQGVRTDLAAAGVADTAITAEELGLAIAAGPDEGTRLRVFFEFIRGAEAAGPAALRLIQAEPALTGDPRYDTLVAAAAEHIASRLGQPGPLWTITADRFLSTAWWISDLPSTRAFAFVGTPAAFRRHGIYVDRHDLRTDETPVTGPVFDQTALVKAFRRLAAKLEKAGVVGSVHVVGGAAMLLSYNSRVTTRDIDALFAPDGPMLAAIREVASDMGWPNSWLNNQSSVYVARDPGEGNRVFDHPNLTVSTTPPEHLLAMKTLASRGVRDRGDIELLLQRLDIRTPGEVWVVVRRYFGDTPIPDRARLLIEDLLGQP